MAVPTLPAPAMATFTTAAAGPSAACPAASPAEQVASSSLQGVVERPAGGARRPPGRPGRAQSSRGTPARVTATTAEPRRACSRSARRSPGPVARAATRSTRDERPGRVGPLRRRPRRAAGAGGPGRWSTSRWPRSGCRGAGRSRPAGGRRCGPPRWGSRRSPGRCARSGCWSCRRWSPRPGHSASPAPARSRSSRSKPEPTMRGPGPVRGQATEGLGVAVDDGDRVALLDEPHGQARTDPTTSHDDDMHLNHATRIVGRSQLTSGRRSVHSGGHGHSGDSRSGEGPGAHDLLMGWSHR